jgi:colanic acid/amylovoran biosynthesis glycosyltransferase
MTIKVAHLRNNWLPQTETWIYEQVKHLPRHVESHVLCTYTSNLEQFRLPRIYSLADDWSPRGVWDRLLRRAGMRTKIDSLTRLAKRTGAAVAHSHFGNWAWEYMPAVRRAGMKHVVTFYGGPDLTVRPREDSRWRDRYGDLFEHVERVLCEGPHMAEMIRQMGCPPHKVRVHHLGAKVGEFQCVPRRYERGQPLRVLIAGSFREKKGIPYALEACAKVKSRVPVQITLIGDAGPFDEKQEEKRRILQVIKDRELSGNVRMLGFQPHDVLIREAMEHHVFLSPSVTGTDGDTEGGAPVSIVEMLATGMPVVSTRHCDIPNVIPGDSIGLLADERDADGLADRLIWLIDHPECWEAMGLAARRRIEEQFNCTIQGQRLADLYGELVGNAASVTVAPATQPPAARKLNLEPA